MQAALQRLRTGGYSYTLEPGVYGDDTADEFWFDRKEGFCEHIASAFVVLMRALDVPARIVTGYQGGELNDVDGFWALRHSDAHAWAEVWQEGAGWVRVDPTGAVSPGRVGPFQRLAPQPGLFAGAMGAMSPTLAQNLRAAWEALNNGWNQWVLNYTQSRQLDLLKNLGFEAPSLEDLATVLLALVVLASLAGAGWTLWERSRHDPWLRLLGQARTRLGRPASSCRGHARRARWPARLAERFGAGAQAAQDWLLRLEAQRYANAPGPTLAALRAEFRRLRLAALKPLVSRAGALARGRHNRHPCDASSRPLSPWPSSCWAPPSPPFPPRPRKWCAAKRPTPRAKTRCSSPTTWPRGATSTATGCAPPSATRASCPTCRG